MTTRSHRYGRHRRQINTDQRVIDSQPDPPLSDGAVFCGLLLLLFVGATISGVAGPSFLKRLAVICRCYSIVTGQSGH